MADEKITQQDIDNAEKKKHTADQTKSKQDPRFNFRDRGQEQTFFKLQEELSKQTEFLTMAEVQSKLAENRLQILQRELEAAKESICKYQHS